MILMDNATQVEPTRPAFSNFQFEEETVSKFRNQVGGRAEIVSINTIGKDRSIGKPLNKAEYHFYENDVKTLPDILLDYIPCYKGAIEISNGKPKAFEDENKIKARTGCYIVLEDITWNFRKPSIMDLKMGTRQYSDKMPPAKIFRKKQRSLDTTSNDLGLRVAGIRSFNILENCEHFHMSKLQGRTLDNHSILNAFRLFFSDGRRTRYLEIAVFRRKLNRVIELIERMNCRLYCCSLLLVYEAHAEEIAVPKIDMRIIDFAEFQSCTGDGEKYSSPDNGFLQGLTSLVDILQTLLNEGETNEPNQK